MTHCASLKGKRKTLDLEQKTKDITRRRLVGVSRCSCYVTALQSFSILWLKTGKERERGGCKAEQRACWGKGRPELSKCRCSRRGSYWLLAMVIYQVMAAKKKKSRLQILEQDLLRPLGCHSYSLAESILYKPARDPGCGVWVPAKRWLLLLRFLIRTGLGII